MKSRPLRIKDEISFILCAATPRGVPTLHHGHSLDAGPVCATSVHHVSSSLGEGERRVPRNRLVLRPFLARSLACFDPSPFSSPVRWPHSVVIPEGSCTCCGIPNGPRLVYLPPPPSPPGGRPDLLTSDDYFRWLPLPLKRGWTGLAF